MPDALLRSVGPHDIDIQVHFSNIAWHQMYDIHPWNKPISRIPQCIGKFKSILRKIYWLEDTDVEFSIKTLSYKTTTTTPSVKNSFFNMLSITTLPTCTLQWHHNESAGVSNHQPHDCLLNCLFKAQIKENIKAPRHWPLCGEFTGDRWITRTKGQ